MAFGQAAGPPAGSRQLGHLLALVQAAGHADFRDARGPLGLSQRQAAGKFTRQEADALIERLEHEVEQRGHPCGDQAVPVPPRARGVDKLLQGVPDGTLAAELQRRGWVVMQP
jgi:hypothetical protein